MQQAAGHLRRLVKTGVAHRVGQTGVRVAADEGVAGHLGQLLDVRAHQRRAQGAVQAHRQRLGMAHAVPKRGHGLAAQDAPRGVGHGAADDEWQPLTAGFEILVDGKQRRLGVQGVEDGFQQQRVHATFHQRLHLLEIGLAQFLEIHIAGAGVVHVRADAGGFGGGAQSAQSEARFVGGAEFVAGRAGNLRRGAVHFNGQVGHVVIGLGDGGGAKGVGFHHVGASGQITFVDIADHVRAGQAEQLVVAFDVLGEVGKALAHAARSAVALAPVLSFAQFEALDHRAHGAV